MTKKTPRAFPKREHNHAACLEGALARARAICEASGIKWTTLREKVFLAVAKSHNPVSAYELIDMLAADGGKRMAPVSVYRILEVLQNAGLVHKVESRNAFFACMTEHEAQSQPIIFLCEDCGRVAESDAPDAMRAIRKTVEAGHFYARNTVLEVSGVCEDCHHGTAKGKPVRASC